jgi:hypothetical protein
MALRRGDAACAALTAEATDRKSASSSEVGHRPEVGARSTR